MAEQEPHYEAVLLLGPSGVGKTPLGELIEQHGWSGRSCVHFDFGAQLRHIVAENAPNEWVSSDELAFLRDVLDKGALLEDDRLPLAMRILRAFLVEREVDHTTLVVLNGLPRHPGQATAVGSILTVVAVIYLQCDEQSILERITSNVGGDRHGREDDDPAKVLSRFQVFVERTATLIDYYRQQGADILTVDVTATMTPDEVRRQLS